MTFLRLKGSKNRFAHGSRGILKVESVVQKPRISQPLQSYGLLQQPPHYYRLFSTSFSANSYQGSRNNEHEHRTSRFASFIKRFLVGTLVLTFGSVLAVYLYDPQAGVYKWLIMPTMHTFLDAEEAHRLAIVMAKYGLVPQERESDYPSLKTSLWGFDLSNPVGLAAGFDKHGEAIDSILGFGFGAVEVGSITPLPQPGNPKPRMFRLPEDGAVINRYGFNSDGHDAVRDRLNRRAIRHEVLSELETEYDQSVKSKPKSFVEGKLFGVNLGKNKASLAESNQDYVDGVKKLGSYADYLVINISSPNTPGLRSLQRKAPIQKLLSEVKDARDKLDNRPPLLVKIAPDLSDEEIADIADVTMQVGIDGVIIGNTTISRPITLASEPSLRIEAGGLSGAPLKPITLQVVRKFYAATNGTLPIIGCGGIATAQDAVEYAKAGASMVQLYTSLGYQGPGIVGDIKRGIVEQLQAENASSWNDIIGLDHRK